MVTHRGGAEITPIKFAGTCWIVSGVAIQGLLHQSSFNGIANRLLLNGSDTAALSALACYPPYRTMLQYSDLVKDIVLNVVKKKKKGKNMK